MNLCFGITAAVRHGFGYDEMYPDDMLSLSQIGNALSDSGIKFDIVGFDACLMGTIETAYMLEPYADYLVASEEYEPERVGITVNGLKFV